MELTNSLEEYLKTMYILEQTTNEIKVTEIANKLHKTKASVNNAINNLKSEGLIDYEPYGEIKLTSKGKNEALKIINAEEEAKRIKTVLSTDTLNKLARYTHKELGLSSLECGYDINNERCIMCVRIKDREKKENK